MFDSEQYSVTVYPVWYVIPVVGVVPVTTQSPVNFKTLTQTFGLDGSPSNLNENAFDIES